MPAGRLPVLVAGKPLGPATQEIAHSDVIPRRATPYFAGARTWLNERGAMTEPVRCTTLPTNSAPANEATRDIVVRAESPN